MMKKQEYGYFPDDCWELIFRKLGEDDLDSISLVSKRFLLISNRVKHFLTFNDVTLHLFPNILRRFQQIKSIVIATNINKGIDGILDQKIARSGVLYDDEVAERITDDGVDALALKLKELKEIEFSGDSNTCFITDKSLISLSTNCVKLRKIQLYLFGRRQYYLTEDGIGFVMRHSTNLTSISLKFWSSQPSASPFAIGNGFTNAKNLHSLTLGGQALISDKHMSLLAKACPPLKKLELIGFMGGYPENHGALKLLLHACQLTLEELTLSGWSLKNTDISNLAQYLSNLTSINLDGLSGLTSFTFYTLTKSCPLLEILEMAGMRGQEMDTFSPDFLHKNYRMRHLDISDNKWLNDTMLENIGQVCPNIQFLSVKYCLHVTKEGIGEILRRCPAITHLNVSSLEVSDDFLGRYSELNLKTLKAWGTKISDEGMAMIGNRCRKLQYLDIEFCKEVTKKGGGEEL